MADNDWHVGQKVILRSASRYRDDEEKEIVRVGRKYVYIEQWGQERAFHIADGTERGSFGYSSRIGTAEMFEATDRRNEALRKVSITMRPMSWHARLSTDQLERILSILQEGEGGERS